MKVLPGDHGWTWREHHPLHPESMEWSHTGVAVRADGRIVFGAPDGRHLIVFDRSTGSAVAYDTGLAEIHSLSSSRTDGSQVWIADPGEKPQPDDGYRARVRDGRAVLFHPGRGVVREISAPATEASSTTDWRPTSVVEDHQGAIWVADGYGQSLVHKFSHDGDHLLTIDGARAGRQLDCPHGLLLDTRTAEPTILIADRSNHRIIRTTVDAATMTLVADDLDSPSSMALRGASLIVTELGGAVVVLTDAELRDVLFPSPTYRTTQASPWPNSRGGDGRLVRPPLYPAQFRSPHGVAVDASGNIIVTEWIIGGRIVELSPARAR